MKFTPHSNNVVFARPLRTARQPSALRTRLGHDVLALRRRGGSRIDASQRVGYAHEAGAANHGEQHRLGHVKAIIAESAIGTTPPTTKTDCHPQTGINAAEIRPPNTAPSVKPHETHIISVTRLRFGLNSAASAIALGMIAPRPRPVTKRSTSNPVIVVTCVVASMHSPKAKVALISTGLRPILSATTLSTSEPISMPSRPAPNTMPKAALSAPTHE